MHCLPHEYDFGIYKVSSSWLVSVSEDNIFTNIKHLLSVSVNFAAEILSEG